MPESKADDFETSLKALEEIVTKLESAEISLDQSVELYRRGRALARHCTALLDAARKSIEDASLDGGQDEVASRVDGSDEEIPF